MRRLAIAALAVLTAAQAQTLPANAERQIRALLSEKASRNAAQAKMDSHLVHAAEILGGRPVSPDFPTPPGELESVRPDANNFVEVDIRTEAGADLPAFIRGLGGVVVNALPEYQWLRARLPLLSVERVAERGDVRQIHVAARAFVDFAPEGPDAYGDVAHQAIGVRQDFNFDGAGVKVGVLSDGVDSLAGEQANGDLPKTVTVLAGQAGSGDEGTAMLEIVYTLAPGATLYFATGATGEPQMAANIKTMVADGCKIIVDDMLYPNEGVFQDDIIATEIDAATAAGVFYFAAAGNSGNLLLGTSGAWQGDFVDSGTTFSDRSPVAAVHSFGATNYDTLTKASSLTVIDNNVVVSGAYELKWSDPLGHSTNDYDLFITDSSGNVLGSSTNIQNGAQDPEEDVTGSPTVANECAIGTCRILVVKQPQAEPRALYLDTQRGNLQIATNSAIFGHSAASGGFGAGLSGAFSVAATVAPGLYAYWGCTVFAPSCNNGVEPYSSDGPRQMFFYADGTPLTPGNFLIGTGGGVVLNKPDITAADCVETGVLGLSAAGSPVFCGTSAAAPHAAAIAALALEAVPTLSAAQMAEALAAGAIAIEGDAPNVDAGAGIAMAPAAIVAACAYSVNSGSQVGGSGGSVNLSIQAGPNCPWTIAGLPSWIAGAASGAGAKTVLLTVAANSGAARSATFSLTTTLGAPPLNLATVFVAQAGGAPALVVTTKAALLSGFTGGAYSQDLAATGGTGSYTWTVTGGALPPGLALSGAAITGTPTAAGTFGFTLQVADGAGDAASQTFTIVVVSVSGGTALSRVGVLSQFAAGQSWDTAIWIVNNSSAAVPVQLQFHADNGALTLPATTPLTVTQQGDTQTIAATTIDRVLSPNTGLVIDGGLGQSTNVEGWVDVLATGPGIGGFAVFRYAPGGLTPSVSGFVTPWEGTVPLQSQLSPASMTLPFDNTAGFSNGVALGTLSGAPATITATFSDIDGNALGTPQTINLPANGHTAFMLNAQYGFTANAQGTVIFRGTALIGLGLRASPYGTLTSVPAILQ